MKRLILAGCIVFLVWAIQVTAAESLLSGEVSTEPTAEETVTTATETSSEIMIIAVMEPSYNMKGNKLDVAVSIKVVNDGDKQPVSDATIIADWVNTAGGGKEAATCKTGADGKCTMDFSTVQPNGWRVSNLPNVGLRVWDVTHEALVYDENPKGNFAWAIKNN